MTSLYEKAFNTPFTPFSGASLGAGFDPKTGKIRPIMSEDERIRYNITGQIDLQRRIKDIALTDRQRFIEYIIENDLDVKGFRRLKLLAEKLKKEREEADEQYSDWY